MSDIERTDSNINHDETSNRTHNGDDLSPNSIDEASVIADELSTDPGNKGVAHSITSAITDGYPVGYAPGLGTYSVDPANYTDSGALQEIIDWGVSSSDDSVEIHIPANKPDGTEWSFDSTVRCGDYDDVNDVYNDAVVSLHFHGFNANQYLNTTIDDGSPVFELGGGGRGGKITGHPSFNGNGNNCVFFNIQKWNNWVAKLGYLFNFTGTAVEFGDGNGGGVNEFFLYINMIIPDDQQTTKTAIGIHSGNNASIFDGRIVVDGVSTAHSETLLLDSGDTDNLVYQGLSEGAHGQAAISIANGGSLHLLPGTRVTGTKNGAHGVYCGDGTEKVVIRASSFRGVAGNAIYCPNEIDVLNIADGTIFGVNSGDAINVGTDVRVNGVVPYEETIDGTVTYPSTWNGLNYPDGWQLRGEGSFTLSGGAGTGISNAQAASTNFNVDGGQPNTQLKAVFDVDKPSFDANFGIARNPTQNWIWDYDGGADGFTLVKPRTFWTDDPGSGNDVTVNYKLYRR